MLQKRHGNLLRISFLNSASIPSRCMERAVHQPLWRAIVRSHSADNALYTVSHGRESEFQCSWAVAFCFHCSMKINSANDVSYFIGVVISLLKCIAACTIYIGTHTPTLRRPWDQIGLVEKRISRDALETWYAQQPVPAFGRKREGSCSSCVSFIFFPSWRLWRPRTLHEGNHIITNFLTSSLVSGSVIWIWKL